MKTSCLTLAFIAALTVSGYTADNPPNADNTAKNERDRSKQTKTPIDQSNSKEDVKISADIRKAIIKDKSLSMTAKNVKIITSGGQVTLRGPVMNADEKMKIASAARTVAGAEKVTDELEIKK